MEGADPAGAAAAAVVDAAQPGPALVLPCGAPDVRAGEPAGWNGRDAALASPHRGVPDGGGPVAAADRRAGRPRSRPSDHDPESDTTPRAEDVIRRVLAHHSEPARQAARRAAPPPDLATGPRPCRCCSGRRARDHGHRRGPGGGPAVPGGRSRLGSSPRGRRGQPGRRRRRTATRAGTADGSAVRAGHREGPGGPPAWASVAAGLLADQPGVPGRTAGWPPALTRPGGSWRQVTTAWLHGHGHQSQHRQEVLTRYWWSPSAPTSLGPH